MKRINLLSTLDNRFLNHNIYQESAISIGITLILAIAVWFGGPYLYWENYAPLFTIEKRLYVICALWLLWLLKFLLIDLAKPNPLAQADARTRKRLELLLQRFRGAMTFLKKTTIHKQGQAVSLNSLPWHLLIGSQGSGKTHVLAHAGVNYVLHKQFAQQNTIPPSETCDWWVTKELCIIDVPGCYFTEMNMQKSPQTTANTTAILWEGLLRLIKKQRGKYGLDGIIIALPLPEMIYHKDTKQQQALFEQIFKRLQDLKKYFSNTLHCHIIITKCDLLPGFAQFFAETGSDEINQAWGIHCHTTKNELPIDELFTLRFNALIKKLNEQLLWRMHQERNPLARPEIKDFPLQIEKIKEYLIDFTKKLSSDAPQLCLQGVYLVSAMQPPATQQNILEAHAQEAGAAHRGIQLYTEPTATSRAYFIKQVINKGLHQVSVERIQKRVPSSWRTYAIYSLAATFLGTSLYLLVKNFNAGLDQTHAIQAQLNQYQIAIQHTHDPDIHLTQTLALLNSIASAADQRGNFHSRILHLLNYYSDQSLQRTTLAYHDALQTILLPQIGNYLAAYLKFPVNNDPNTEYAVLATYLMLNEPSKVDTQTFFATVDKILPKNLSKEDKANLVKHLSLGLRIYTHPIALNETLIAATRNYLRAMAPLALSYTILNNMHQYQLSYPINLGTHETDLPIFNTQSTQSKVTALYLGKNLPSIMATDTMTAAQEALMGNWVLGNSAIVSREVTTVPELTDALRESYIKRYVSLWENVLSGIQLTVPEDLEKIDNMIVALVSKSSPMLQLLKTIHDNTNFDAVNNNSVKLSHLNNLMAKRNEAQNQLYQVFAGLQNTHQYLQRIMTASNEKKAAFEAVSQRMQQSKVPDALTQLRIIATNSPEPVQHWLEKIVNQVWRILMHDASQYLDTSWQTKVVKPYQEDIANRYPFDPHSDSEVALHKFIAFFGNPGIVINFYAKYLEALVDTTAPEWHWRQLDHQVMAFNKDILKQIQYSMRIHESFFPKGDNQFNFQFSLKPYEFDPKVTSVRLSFNDKQYVDEKDNLTQKHHLRWLNDHGIKVTSVQFTMDNQQMIIHSYPGDWGLYKLISKSLENAITKKQMVLNLSINQHSVKYLLTTEGPSNPFLSLNLEHYHLPDHLLA